MKEEVIVDESDNITFENQDDTKKEEVVEKEYNKIDHLDEHEPDSGYRWALFSFISPEGIHNCKIRGLKIWDVYRTEEKAKEMLPELRKKEKYFDILLGEVGKWLPWDPDQNQVKEQVYDNKKLQKLMNQQQKKNLDDLNTLVEKRKQQLNTAEKTHNKRVENALKNAKSTVEETKAPKVDPHSQEIARSKLKKILKQREDAKAPVATENDLKIREELLKKESERLKSKELDLTTSVEKMKSVNDNISKIQDYLKKYKNKKDESSKNE